MINTLLKFERELWKQGKTYIAGVDEVGRGSLAGPMVVASVILNQNHLSEYNNLPANFQFYDEIRDSKLLSPKKRRELSKYIKHEAIAYSIVEISNIQIDELGLTECTEITFYESIKKLSIKPNHILTDAFRIRHIDSELQTNIIKGDQKSITIAAASIIAKVYRDDIMVKLHESSDSYKVYGFNKHKGYATKYHRNMIEEFGYSDIHRKSFILKPSN